MEKLKVILIDDEMLIRKLIRMKMDTEGLNMEIVGEYPNGADAFQEIEQIRPDIVISDICMPEEDGLSFSEKCAKVLPETKIILVTGYDDFNYARRSIKVGIFDYLLKPVQSEELNGALKRAADEIRALRGQKAKQKELLDEMEKNKTVFRDIYINKILAGENVKEDFEVKLAEYGIRIYRNQKIRIRVAVLVIREGLYELEMIRQVVSEANAFFQSDEGVVVLKDLWNRIVIISNNEEIPFAECIDILVSLIRAKCECHLYAGISNAVEGWEMMRNAYLEALECIRNKREEEKGTKIRYPHWELLKKAIVEGEVEATQELVKECVSDMKTDMVDMQRKVQMSCQKLYIDLEISQRNLLFDKELRWCYTREHLEYCLGSIVTELIIRKKIERAESNGEIIKELLIFMLEHIDMEELSLNYLSTEFSISNSHLSKMFKNFTGKKYIELQSDIRLLKMLELVHTTSLKDYDIGRMIGIQDAHYLSIWFKKMMGCSITEYRKLSGIQTKK